jgi:hypothetical protein
MIGLLTSLADHPECQVYPGCLSQARQWPTEFAFLLAWLWLHLITGWWLHAYHPHHTTNERRRS